MTRLGRLQAHWVYGGFLAGLMLLVLAPLLTEGWSRGAWLAFLVLPVYMVHQFEEHDADRFRRFVNAELAGGREALSVAAVFWINILGVWAVTTATLWLTRRVDVGWGVLAAYLVLVNGLLHLAQGVALRRYNPGLVTGVALFLPLGAGTLAALRSVASVSQHLVALAVVIAIHVWIILHVRKAIRTAPPGAATKTNGG